MRYGSKQIRKQIFVVKNQKNSLLSKSACVELGLIKLVKPDEINEVSQNQNLTNQRSDNAEESKKSSEPDFRTEFPELFSGQGKTKMDPYKITLKPNAEPYCLYTPRKIAHPLILQVKEEIEAMLKQGVVSEVTALPEWCARIVPVPKKNNRVRICVDLTNLNHAVERVIYPIKSVDYNLALLGRSKIFTKLDAASGFWQLPLHPDSQLLTTFIISFGKNTVLSDYHLEYPAHQKYFGEPCHRF